MDDLPSINITYAPPQDAAAAQAGQQVFKLINYSECAGEPGTDPRHISVCLPQMVGTPLTEIWLSPEPVQQQRFHDIDYTCNSHILCGHILVHESDEAVLQHTTKMAYEQIFALLRHTDYAHLIRTWNYFANINQVVNGLERYQAFCIGRAEATSVAGQIHSQFPAASAIGSHSGPLVIYFIAAKDAGLQLENPLQTSAFHYPKIYSPQSPTFSRAMIKRWQNSTQLYISGTASVLGHRTVHIDNLEQQYRQTLTNLQALTSMYSTQQNIPVDFSLAQVLWKVYLRDAGYTAQLKELVNTTLNPCKPVMYLQGDICRADLLLEIEGYYSWQRSSYMSGQQLGHP